MGIVQQREEMRREIKRKQKEVLPKLEKALRNAKAEKRKRLKACEQECKAKIKKNRERAARAKKLLDKQIKKARAAAQQVCSACNVSATQEGIAKIEKTIDALNKEAETIKKMRYEVRTMKSAKGSAGGRRAAELRAESDDEVVRNLGEDQEMVALFKKLRRKIKKTPHLSRTEAFLEYVHNHPEELDELRSKKQTRYMQEAEEMLKERPCTDELENCQYELQRLKRAERMAEEVPF